MPAAGEKRGARLSARVRALLQGSVTAGATWLPWTIVLGLAPGAALWALTHESRLTHLIDNRLERPDRTWPLAYTLGSLVATLVLLALFVAAERAPRAPLERRAQRFNRRLAFVLALPGLVALGIPGFETAHRIQLLTLAAVAGIGCAVGATAWSSERFSSWAARARLAQSVGEWGGLVLVVLAGAGYAYHLASLQIIHHQNFQTGAYDLGIYVNVVWHSLQGDLLGSSYLRGGTHLSAHCDPILIAISPVLLIQRGAEALLVLQAAWLASSVVPLYLFARDRLGTLFGIALALSYLLLPSLHAITIFDFHSLSLSIPVVLWALLFLERGRPIAYAVSLFVLLMVREDMALVACCLGAYAIVGPRRVGWGALTIFVSLAWLAFVKRFLMLDSDLMMADSTQSYSVGSLFTALTPHGSGVAAMAETAAGNPFFVIHSGLIEGRVYFALLLLVPVLFLPLLSGRRWVLGAFAIAFLLLATNEWAYSPAFHYAALAVPSLFALAAIGGETFVARASTVLGVARARLAHGLAAGILAASLIVGAGFGVIWENDAFRASWYALERHPSREQRQRWETFRELYALMGEDDSVCASGFLFPHIAARMEAQHLPECAAPRWAISLSVGERPHERDAMRTLERSGEYTVARRVDGFTLLQRIDAAPAGEGTGASVEAP